jgi:outer membrane protein OmpA-like peptidoglycan-associated protein
MRTARLVLCLAATLLAGCGSQLPRSTSPNALDGRGLQVPWWEAMPEVPVPTATLDASSAVSEPAPTIDGELVIPGDTLFDPGSASVRGPSVEKLRAFAARLAPHLAADHGPWVIAGATDSTGSTEANDRLGLARATAVLEVIASVDGVDPARFRVESWGEVRPAVDESGALDPAEARARNRRVLILPPGSTTSGRSSGAHP